MRATKTNGAVLRRVGLLLGLLACAGCQNFDLKKPIPWSKSGEKADAPVRLVAVWSETVLHRPDQAPQRGFGGRILFYDSTNSSPIKAEGTLVVYAFDESNAKTPHARPDRKFVFPADQFVKHFSETKLGPSYSFWLPWDNVGGEQRKITLIARFQPNEGATIVGESSHQLLSGTVPAEGEPNLRSGAARPLSAVPQPISQPAHASQPAPIYQPAPMHQPATNGGVVPVGYNEQVGQSPVNTEYPTSAKRMTTTTIPVPTNFGQGLPIEVPAQQPARYPRPENSPATQPNLAAPVYSGSGATNSPGASRFGLGRPRALGRPITRPDAARASWR